MVRDRGEGSRLGGGLMELLVGHGCEVLDYVVSVHLSPSLCSSMASWSRNHWPPIFFPPSFGASLRAWRSDNPTLSCSFCDRDSRWFLLRIMLQLKRVRGRPTVRLRTSPR